MRAFKNQTCRHADLGPKDWESAPSRSQESQVSQLNHQTDENSTQYLPDKVRKNPYEDRNFVVASLGDLDQGE